MFKKNEASWGSPDFKAIRYVEISEDIDPLKMD
jgi:hypothetical protein